MSEVRVVLALVNKPPRVSPDLRGVFAEAEEMLLGFS